MSPTKIFLSTLAISLLMLSTLAYAAWYDSLISTIDSFIDLFASPPVIKSASADPLNVKHTDILTITVQAEDKYGIESVKAYTEGLKTLELSLVAGDEYAGVWQVKWAVEGAVEKNYTTEIIVANAKGKASSAQVTWTDPAEFNFQRTINITSTFSANKVNYRQRISFDTASLISAGKMRSDCGDMRFYDTAYSTELELDYWIESGCNSASTRIWVEVPSMLASSVKTIHVRFGNSAVTTASNATLTFGSVINITASETSGASYTAGLFILNSGVTVTAGSSTLTINADYSAVKGTLDGDSTTGRTVELRGQSSTDAIEIQITGTINTRGTGVGGGGGGGSYTTCCGCTGGTGGTGGAGDSGGPVTLRATTLVHSGSISTTGGGGGGGGGGGASRSGCNPQTGGLGGLGGTGGSGSSVNIFRETSTVTGSITVTGGGGGGGGGGGAGVGCSNSCAPDPTSGSAGIASTGGSGGSGTRFTSDHYTSCANSGTFSGGSGGAGAGAGGTGGTGSAGSAVCGTGGGGRAGGSPGAGGAVTYTAISGTTTVSIGPEESFLKIAGGGGDLLIVGATIK